MPSSRAPPADVSPGHIMFAPESTNLIAPRSTCTLFIKCGSRKVKPKESRSDHSGHEQKLGIMIRRIGERDVVRRGHTLGMNEVFCERSE